jgi:RHS repeat-associated protein
MLEAFIDVSSNKGPVMPTSKPANHSSRILLLAGDSKNTVLAEMAGGIHRFAYSPYGQQSSGQEVRTRLGFNGELLEAKTDGYFLGNGYRVYNPGLMRFQSPDKFSPFGKGGLNTYMYCGGEPVRRTDPTGEGWLAKWLFERFADVMQIFSPVGTGGSVGRKARAATQAGNEGMVGILLGMEKNQKTSFLKPSKATLGKSTSQQGLPTGPTTSRTTSTPAEPGARAVPTQSKTARTKLVLEGNYGKRPQREYSTVQTRDGFKISGTDSGTRQFPSSSRTVSDIRS